MFALLFFLFGCLSEQGLTYEVIKEVEVVVYDTAYVEVEVEVGLVFFKGINIVN